MSKKKFKYQSKDKKTMIQAIVWTPDFLSDDKNDTDSTNEKEIKGVVQIVHGMIEYVDKYDELARYLNDKGYVVCGHDHIGHGDSVNSKDDWGYFTEYKPEACVCHDIHSLRKRMVKKYPDVPYYIIGHSMGSYILRHYLMKFSEGLSGAIIMGTGYQSPLVTTFGLATIYAIAAVKGWRYKSKLVQDISYDPYYRKFDLYGEHPENNWLTSDIDRFNEYYYDERSRFMFTLNGYKMLVKTVDIVCKQKNVGLIPKDLPILFASGSDDPVGALGKGVKKVYKMFQKAGINDVTMKLYEGDRHEITNEKDRQQVFLDFYNWFEAHN